MALYLGSSKRKLLLDNSGFKLNIPNATVIRRQLFNKELSFATINGMFEYMYFAFCVDLNLQDAILPNKEYIVKIGNNSNKFISQGSEYGSVALSGSFVDSGSANLAFDFSINIVTEQEKANNSTIQQLAGDNNVIVILTIPDLIGSQNIATTIKIYEEQQVVSNFAYASMYGSYTTSTSIMFPIELNETYTVIWDDVKYTCTAQPMTVGQISAVCLGNCTPLGGNGNNEPFVIACDTTNGYNYYFAFTEDTSHKVMVYK